MHWIIGPLKKYADFGGRASRSEFWVFLLFFPGSRHWPPEPIEPFLLPHRVPCWQAGSHGSSCSCCPAMPAKTPLVRRLHNPLPCKSGRLV